MIVKLSSRYGDVYVNTSNVTWFRHDKDGTIIFFGNTEDNFTVVAEKPEAVAKKMKAGDQK